MYCIGVTACSTNEITSQEDSQNKKSPIVIEAMEYIKSKSELSLPNMHKTLHSIGQVSTRTTELKFNPEDIAPNWNALQTSKDGDDDIWMFPLSSSTSIQGSVYTRIRGKIVAQATFSSSKLLIRKREGKMVSRIITYIPERKFLRVKGNSVAKLGYQLKGSNFSGICLISSLNGLWIYGEKYDEGNLLFRFGPNIHKHESKARSSAQSMEEEENGSKYKLYFELLAKQKTGNSLVSYSRAEQEALYCSFCGLGVDECSCVTIYPDSDKAYCPHCGGPFENCYCCLDCHDYPCTCEKEDTNRPTGGGGSGGGSSGGGSSGGGGTTTHQFSVAMLKSITSAAVKKVLSDHNNNTTSAYCNEGVRNAFNQISYTQDLNNMNANTMTNHWKNHPEKWESISMSQAQGLANNGYFVVAGYYNSSGGSGHVVVIVPGSETYSRGWGEMVPQTMDTGQNMRATSQPFSYSFGWKTKKGKVVFYKYESAPRSHYFQAAPNCFFKKLLSLF